MACLQSRQRRLRKIRERKYLNFFFFCLSAGEKGIEGRKLLERLDKNHLYANYSEIDDEEHQISDENKRINKEFYQT